MNKKILYRKAYKLLENSTPLKYDCGELCNSRCCSGTDDMGMLLFPGEEEILVYTQPHLEFSTQSLAGIDAGYAVCKGSCSRDLRPLSCRMYPYAPYIDENGVLNIIKDPRAAYTCPILSDSSSIKTDRFFLRKLYSVFHILIQDSDIKLFIEVLSDILKDYARFTGTVV